MNGRAGEAREKAASCRQLALRLRQGRPVRRRRVADSSRFDFDRGGPGESGELPTARASTPTSWTGPFSSKRDLLITLLPWRNGKRPGCEARSIDNPSPVEKSIVSRQHFRDFPASGSGGCQAGKRNKSDPQGSGYAGLPLDRRRVLMHLPRAEYRSRSDESTSTTDPRPRRIA